MNKLHETRETVSFITWMSYIDAVSEVIFEIPASHMPDQTWRDWYDEELSVIEAISQLVQNESGNLIWGSQLVDLFVDWQKKWRLSL